MVFLALFARVLGCASTLLWVYITYVTKTLREEKFLEKKEASPLYLLLQVLWIVRVSVDCALVILTCGMLMVLRALCVFELLNTLNCAVQLLLCWLGLGCGGVYVVVSFCGYVVTSTTS